MTMRTKGKDSLAMFFYSKTVIPNDIQNLRINGYLVRYKEVLRQFPQLVTAHQVKNSKKNTRIVTDSQQEEKQLAVMIR